MRVTLIFKNQFQKGFIPCILIQRVLDNLMGVVMRSDFVEKAVLLLLWPFLTLIHNTIIENTGEGIKLKNTSS